MLQSHSELLRHLRWRRCSTVQGWGQAALLSDPVLLTQLSEVRVLQGLAGVHAVLLVVDQQLGDDVGGHIVLWHERQDAAALLRRKVKFHVAGELLKLV